MKIIPCDTPIHDLREQVATTLEGWERINGYTEDAPGYPVN